jgi:CubicO group peptidase (beta-lactamase class C family)
MMRVLSDLAAMPLHVRRLMIAAAAAILGATTVLATAAQPPWASQVDGLFARWDRSDSPGCALGVFRDGRIAYARGYGMADAEHDVPITVDSVFYVGSLSKQFTAMAAALAIQQGKLSVEDPIRRYLPELPDYASRITVGHLLHHTSGLRDYNTLLSIAGRRGDEAYDNRVVLRMTARQKALNFAPGDEYLYSNTGYTLLASVIERATGKPFAAFAGEHVFTPLGMTVTHYHVDATRLIRDRAMAYERGASGPLLLDTPSNERAGAGGVFTNIPDLLRWDENFYTGRVGGMDLLRQLQTPGRLNDGRPLKYAWGLEIDTYRGLPIVEHGGSLGGYRAHLLRFPSQHASVAILCNLGSIAPGPLARQVADIVVADRFTQPADKVRLKPDATPPAAGPTFTSGLPSAPVRTLGDYAGTYYSDEIDATFTVSIDGGRLMLQRDTDTSPAALLPAAVGQFQFKGMAIRFERVDGKVTALSVDAGRVRDIRFDKARPGT